MPNTPHIKRFEEYEDVYEEPRDVNEYINNTPPLKSSRLEQMLDDLAEHIERLEERVNQRKFPGGPFVLPRTGGDYSSCPKNTSGHFWGYIGSDNVCVYCRALWTDTTPNE